MKIEGLGAQQITAMMLLNQVKNSEMKDSPAFSIMMQSVVSSMAENTTVDEIKGQISELKEQVEKNQNEDLNLKPTNPNITVNENVANKSDRERIDNAVNVASAKYGVDRQLIRAIIKTESNFNPKVTSSAGAQGVMQIMPANFKMLGITDGYNIEQNIDGGVKLLKQYLDKFGGNTEMALMAYNGGPGTMQKRGVKSPADVYKMPKETQNYLVKVSKYYNEGV